MGSGNDRRWVVRIVAALAALALLSEIAPGCSSHDWKGTVKLGYVGPFSGYDAETAYAGYNAVQLAISEANRAGGVGGQMVELVALDDENDPQQALYQAGEMAGDPTILGVVGHLGAEPASAAEPEYHRAGLPAVTLAPGWEGEAPPEVLRLGPSMDELADRVAFVARQRYDNRLLAVVYEQDEEQGAGTSQRLAERAASRAQAAGVQVADPLGVGRLDRDWPALAQRLRQSGAGLVFFSGGFEATASFWSSVAADLPGVDLLASYEADTPDFYRSGKQGLAGVLYLSSTYTLGGDSESMAQFATSYRERTGKEPSSTASMAYDAATLLLGAASSSAETGKPATRAVTLEVLQRQPQPKGAGVTVKWGRSLPAAESTVPVFRLDAGGYPGRREY